MERQIITVDIAPGYNKVERLKSSQGDIGRPLGVYITQNGTALDCSAYTADLYILKPDGNFFTGTVTVDATEHNLITWDTAEQETPVAGECAAQIRILNNGDDIGTARFVEYVEASPGFCGEASESVVESLMEYVRQAAASAETASGAASSASGSASAASGSASAAASSASAAAGSASTAHTDAETASQAAQTAQNVADSIPEDYSTLSDDVTGLKSAIDATMESGWDNDFDESGYIVDGTNAPGSSFVRTSQYYDCANWGTGYLAYESDMTGSTLTLVLYDENKGFISNTGLAGVTSLVIPNSAKYFRMYKRTSYTGKIYFSNIRPTSPVDYSTQYTIKADTLRQTFTMQAEGLNAFDSNFDASGYILNGDDAVGSAFVRTSKFYDCSTWENVYVRHENTVETFTLVFYDASKTFIENVGASTDLDYKKPTNAAYFRAYKRVGTARTYISYAIPSGGELDYAYSERKMLDITVSNIPRQEFLNFKNRVLCTGNKTIVNFGDSIIGNTQDNSSVSGILSGLSGYNTVNVGFGGCRMSKHTSSGWDAFSMCLLADAIVSEDWSAQDAAIAQASTLNLPGYFSAALARLKEIDFSTVYMITIEYGTNDWSGGVPLDNSENAEDINTYAGALRYLIKKLQTAFPKLKIVVQNPVVRINPSTGETSDTMTNASNLTLVQYINAENDVCKVFKIPVIDAYYKSGFNIYNHDYYYSTPTDDVHLGYNGRFRLAEMYASYLLANYR